MGSLVTGNVVEIAYWILIAIGVTALLFFSFSCMFGVGGAWC